MLRSSGYRADGTPVPKLPDGELLDFLETHRTSIKLLKGGVQAVGVPAWQPNVRAAIEAAIDAKLQKSARGVKDVLIVEVAHDE